MTYNSSKTGAQVDGAVTDVQNAKAASATDTTSGRLLKVGDFGVGSTTAILGIDPDDLTATGVYAPSTAFFSGGELGLHMARNTDIATQLILSRSVDRAGWRRKTGGIWGPLLELYHTGNTIVDGNGFIKEA